MNLNLSNSKIILKHNEWVSDRICMVNTKYIKVLIPLKLRDHKESSYFFNCSFSKELNPENIVNSVLNTYKDAKLGDIIGASQTGVYLDIPSEESNQKYVQLLCMDFAQKITAVEQRYLTPFIGQKNFDIEVHSVMNLIYVIKRPINEITAVISGEFLSRIPKNKIAAFDIMELKYPLL